VVEGGERKGNMLSERGLFEGEEASGKKVAEIYAKQEKHKSGSS